jgi:uracil-DNA glycosylase family 4
MPQPQPATVRNIFGNRVIVPNNRNQQGAGCAYCPLDKAPGIIKIKGLDRIKGRRAMLWAQSPGRVENEKGLELVGPSGQLFWELAKQCGLSRDQFDVQNSVRCRPTNKEGKDRDPTKDEIHCCSTYNEEALYRNGGKADVHLILGEIAAKALLKKAYRKGTPVMWHEPWNAYVVLAPHPSYALRKRREGSETAVIELRDRIKAAKAVLNAPGRFGYVLRQDYGDIRDPNALGAFLAFLEGECGAGRYISTDLEWGTVGGRVDVPLMAGFGWGQYQGSTWKGGARSVLLEHPGYRNPYLGRMKEKLSQFYGDKSVRKSLHNGSGDVKIVKHYFGCKFEGYAFDSYYGAYLYDSNLQKYGLDALIKRWYLEFADYKVGLVGEDVKNFAEVPLDKLVPYNCADAELGMRLTEKVKDKISLPLLQIYILDGFVFDGMGKRGPFLDYQEHARLYQEVPKMIEPLLQKLRVIAGKPDFNPGSHDQVAWLLYDELRLPAESRSTNADDLEIIYNETKHPVLKLVIQYRALSIIVGTFLEGFRRSAEANGGRITTKWFLAGTATGRLRSGGDGEEGYVNLQNVPSEPLISSLLVSDPRWRDAL